MICRLVKNRLILRLFCESSLQDEGEEKVEDGKKDLVRC